MAAIFNQITEKEKETLRLIARGHDAKSAASALEVSVHTVNERLRNARRKLGVTSSREAARALLDAEQDAPENLVPEEIGEASWLPSDDKQLSPPRDYPPWIGGFVVMSILAALAIFALAGVGPNAEQPLADATAKAVASADAEREDAARAWLTLVDKSDWKGSFEAAGSAFRDPNTIATWKAASEQARGPLGALLSREVIAISDIASPERYQLVQFRADFANRKGVIESITLQREDGVLRVVGYFLN